MPVTNTWDDHYNPPYSFEINDEVIASMEQGRKHLAIDVIRDPATGRLAAVQLTMSDAERPAPMFPDVLNTVVGIFALSLVQMSLERFPTSDIAQAQANLAAAQQALALAQMAAIPGFLPPTG